MQISPSIYRDIEALEEADDIAADEQDREAINEECDKARIYGGAREAVFCHYANVRGRSDRLVALNSVDQMIRGIDRALRAINAESEVPASELLDFVTCAKCRETTILCDPAGCACDREMKQAVDVALSGRNILDTEAWTATLSSVDTTEEAIRATGIVGVVHVDFPESDTEDADTLAYLKFAEDTRRAWGLIKWSVAVLMALVIGAAFWNGGVGAWLVGVFKP